MLRELLATFTIDPTQAQSALHALDSAIEGAKGSLGALADAFVGSAFVGGLKSFVETQILTADSLVDTADKLGVGADALQRFQYGASTAGVAAESAAQAIGALNKNMGEALTGSKESAATFASLGVAIRDGEGGARAFGDMLPEIADGLAKMGSQQERTVAAMKLFGKSGAALLPFLQQGREGVEKLDAEFRDLGGGFSRDFLDASDKAGDALGRMNFALSSLKAQLAFAIIPSVERASTKITGWISSLTKLTRETTLGKTAWVVFGAASAAASVQAAAGFMKLLGVLPKGGGFWKSILGLGQIGLVIAAVAILALAFEDLFVFLSGGDSVIGELIDSLFGVGASKEVLEEVRKAFGEFWQEIAAFEPVVKEVGKLLSEAWSTSLPYLKEAAKSVMQFGAVQLTTVLKLVRFLVGELGAGLELFGRFASAGSKFAGMLGKDGLAEKLGGMGLSLQATGAGLQQASSGVTVPRSAEERTTRAEIMQNNRINVNVEGGATPQETGRAVAGGVKNGMSGSLDAALAAIDTGG